MLNLKKNSEQDIDSLIESMLRLIEYMSSNPGIKKQIFQSFNNEDLQKILKNLNEKKSIFLRKVSAVFICVILQNEENCSSFMKLCDLIPTNSKISINGVPEKLSKFLTSELLQKLHTVQTIDNNLCQYYTIQMAKDQLPNLAHFQLNFRELRKSINEFIDPLETLIIIQYRKQELIQQWQQKTEIHKMSISPVSKQLTQPIRDIQNQRKKYQVVSMHQQQTKPISMITQIQKPDNTSFLQYDIVKHRNSDNQRAVKSAMSQKRETQQQISTSMDYKLKSFNKNY